MTDLADDKRCGLCSMAGDSGTFKVTVAGKLAPIKRPITAHHGVAQAPFSRGSWGLR